MQRGSAVEHDRHAGPQAGHRRRRLEPHFEGAQVGAAWTRRAPGRKCLSSAAT
ncbi:hypothetical protein LP420_09915 [Massilia sp. B-10]|nr:hypothetical protein LP420_09915 [Massilia sp. B-10]